MLYITTRNSNEFYTSHHALQKDRGACGGLYIPFQTYRYSPDEIESFKEKSFCQCVAEILNLFFSARLDTRDVECCIGSYPLKLVPMSHKITIAEIWNNPEWSFSRFVRNLNGRILGGTDTGHPKNWTWTAVRIAVLFGIYAKLRKSGLIEPNQKIDVSVCTGDFSGPMAAWYARNMGLPIGTIIFNCNDNSSAWDLLHHGEIRTNEPVIKTSTPMCDFSVPLDLERLIYETLGRDEVFRFVSKNAAGDVYALNEDSRQIVREGLFGAVVGDVRTASIIRNVYRTNAYLLGPYSALAYGGLQDYRATSTEISPALILTEEGPLRNTQTIANAIGITMEVIQDRFRSV